MASASVAAMIMNAIAAVSLAIQLSAPAPSATPTRAQLVGLAGNPSASTVVAWTDTRVYVVSDGFREVLHGRGRVEAATVSDQGAVYVFRGGLLGRHHAGRDSWTSVPKVSEVTTLWARAGRVLIDARGTFHVTADHKTWTTLDWEMGNDSQSVALDAHGGVQIVTGFEASCGGGYQERRAGPIAGPLTEREWPLDTFAYVATADGGWTYAISTDPDGAGLALIAVAPDATTRRLSSADDWEFKSSIGDGVTFLVLGTRLMRLASGRARVVDRNAPRGAKALAVDQHDAAWVLTGHGLHRRGALGWQTVHAW